MPSAIIVVGLGNGDEGKGSLVDHLVRKHGARQVVRFNGGAQARHHVVYNGLVHGFSQFGAGTLAGARTILSRFMLFEPLSFCREALCLSKLGIPDPYSLVTISARAPVITPANILTNRILEIHRGAGRHGSCGLGIGVTQEDVEKLGQAAIYAGDLQNPARLREKLEPLWQRRLETVGSIEREETRELRRQLADYDLQDLLSFYVEFSGRVRIVPDEVILEMINRESGIFEGAQGVLLDQRWGFFPHNTWSTTTFENAETLLAESGFRGEPIRVGLLRAYATRHGAGPFPTETGDLVVDPCHNESNDWQGAFRTGWFDAVAARYALGVVRGVDILGLTNLDRLVGLEGLKAAVTYTPSKHFPNGRIPFVSADLQALQQRTEALFHARPEYMDLPPIRDKSPGALFRYADAIAELTGHNVNLLSARPDHQKIYRTPA